jgi:hypothetical protein
VLQAVEIYNTVEEKIDTYNYSFVRKNIEEIRKGKLDRKYLKKALQTFLYLTSNDVKNKGITERILKDDTQMLIAGLYSSSRFQYINYSTKEFEDDGADCLHIYKVLDASSIKDFEVISKYLAVLPGPAKHGHRFSRLLCNSVYTILRKNPEEMTAAAAVIRKYNDKAVFDKAMLDASLAIIEGSPERLREAIQTMLENNKKKYHNDGALQYICIAAHAFIHLAEYVHGDTWGDIAGNLKSIYWDEQFYTDVKFNRQGSLKGLCSLEAVSPILHRWAEELPVGFSLEDSVVL